MNNTITAAMVAGNRTQAISPVTLSLGNKDALGSFHNLLALIVCNWSNFCLLTKGHLFVLFPNCLDYVVEPVGVYTHFELSLFLLWTDLSRYILSLFWGWTMPFLPHRTSVELTNPMEDTVGICYEFIA